MQSNSSPVPKRARSQGPCNGRSFGRNHKELTKPQDPTEGVIAGLVSISSDVAPPIREYGRTSIAVANRWLVGHPEKVN
jgi:hypothetical protein